jgi:sterol desaturase/sphingolipid hydroxylase (fatty acid hydroxylase superfamily)
MTNAGVAVPTFAVLRLVLIPAEVAVAYWAAQHEAGLLYLFSLSSWLHGALAFLFLDYLLYLWHRLNHQIPFLWRFHNVHHTDLDLGVTTAFRFHFGEMLLSAFFRAAGVLLVGAGPVAVLVHEVAFQASVAFHHSNWRLPFWLERPLSWIIVTPRMHGIHHSIVQRETNSNYANLLTLWDRLHRTIRLNVRQNDVVVGVPGYQEDGYDHTLLGLLTLPFRRQKVYWRLPDGTQPDRPDEGNRGRLAP